MPKHINCSVCGKDIVPAGNRRSGGKCQKCHNETKPVVVESAPNSRRKLCPICKTAMIRLPSAMCLDCSKKSRASVRVSLQNGVIPEGQKCGHCGCTLTAENWPEIMWRYDAVNRKCYTCYRAYANKILKKHYHKTSYKQRMLKKEVLEHYGNECQCCHEKNPGFLSIDHINSDGGDRRKKNPAEYNIYRWAKMHDYPNDLRILCYNCNMGRSKNGGICPHVEYFNGDPHEIERQKALQPVV